MTLGKAFRLATAWCALAITIVGLAFVLSPELRAQGGTKIVWLFDGFGNAITSGLEGTIRALDVRLVDPATNAPVAYVTEDRDAGTDGATTLRVTEATDSAISAGVGTTADAAATVGSTGSLAAKLRLITSQLDAHTTALQLIDDDQTGASKCGITTTASTNSTSCKGSAGRILGIFVLNETTTKYYLRLYESAAAPTCSSATGFIQSYPIPPASAAGQVGGFMLPVPPAGIAYATGIGYCITALSTSTDNTNAAAGIFGTLVYK